MKKTILPTVVMACCLATSIVQAGPIYDVSRTVGAGSVVGTIETDGTIGALFTANIIDFSLTLTDGVGADMFTMSATGGGTVGVNGTGLLTATLTQLIFDVSPAVAGNLGFNQVDGLEAWFWTLQGLVVDGGETVSHFSAITNDFHTPASVLTGQVIFATRSVIVPEPTTLWLFGLGLAGLGICRRKHNAHG